VNCATAFFDLHGGQHVTARDGVILPDQPRSDLEKLGAQLGITATF
jgi:hypothetical protein